MGSLEIMCIGYNDSFRSVIGICRDSFIAVKQYMRGSYLHHLLHISFIMRWSNLSSLT